MESLDIANLLIVNADKFDYGGWIRASSPFKNRRPVPTPITVMESGGPSSSAIAHSPVLDPPSGAEVLVVDETVTVHDLTHSPLHAPLTPVHDVLNLPPTPSVVLSDPVSNEAKIHVSCPQEASNVLPMLDKMDILPPVELSDIAMPVDETITVNA
ncbi:hypothetical protein ACOSQ2_020624 [Xanthoceras sorbifolium]